MSQLAILVISLVAGAIGTVIWYMIRRLIGKLDELIKSIEGLTVQTQLQEERLKSVYATISDLINRLNDHGKRIRSMEIRQGKSK